MLFQAGHIVRLNPAAVLMGREHNGTESTLPMNEQI
jgi:hypothetical protein